MEDNFNNDFSNRGGHFNRATARSWLGRYANRSVTARPFGDDERVMNELPPDCGGGTDYAMPVIDFDRQQGDPSEFGDN